MSSDRGNTDGPDAARILSPPRGGRKFEFIDRRPLSDLHVLLQREKKNRFINFIILSRCIHNVVVLRRFDMFYVLDEQQ